MSESTASQQTEAIILFEEGLIGVPRARRFQLLEKPGSAHRVLQCLDLNGFNLPVIDPRQADPDYQPSLGGRVAEALQLEAGDTVLLLAVTSLEPEGSHANLKAPLVINVHRRLAAQIILEGDSYPLRAPVPAGT